MAEKIIYIVRHGETEYNKTGYLQGATINASINEFGRRQSEAFYEGYKDVTFDKIYTSDLKRSIESIDLFLLKEIPVEHFSELNEINWGIMEGKKLSPKAWIRLRRIAKAWAKGELTKKLPGGESPEDVAARQQNFLDIILQREEEKNILICMHGRAMRVLICQLLNEPLMLMDTHKHDNMGLYVIKLEDNKAPVVLKNNSKDHLANVQR